MTMNSQKIAAIFHDMANILEIKGANVFRVRAYQKAAQNIESLGGELDDYLRQDKLKEIPGIGEDLAEKIKEYYRTGKIRAYQQLQNSIPQGLLAILDIPSVGPKTAKLLYEKLKVKSIPDLEKAIRKNKLRGIFGIKDKTIENILKGIALVKRGKERMTIAQAAQAADEFLGYLKNLPQIKKISLAGSLRRQKETVRDIDILVISHDPDKVMDAFVNFPGTREILAKGRTKSSLRTNQDVQVDCRVVEASSFGAALLYFTGSKSFNIKLRQLAIKKGLKINEYGVFKGDKFLAGGSEEEIFKVLGMDYIEPELREDNGEIELARRSRLPRLIQLSEIKGDLHAHSLWSDGGNTIEEMALAARERGYAYIAITDHSQSLKVANGLSVAELKKKKSQIDKLNAKLKNFRVLYGTEVDITSEGAIDYPQGVLAEFDIVVAAVHTGFKQSRQQLTRRIIRACQNKFVHIIAHPTGRLWGLREPYDIDLEEVFKVAAQTNTHLEINSFPQRLDLNDHNCRFAKEKGVKFSIGTDSHETAQLASMKFGVSVARRGWLGKEDVINTLPLEKLLKEIKK